MTVTRAPLGGKAAVRATRSASRIEPPASESGSELGELSRLAFPLASAFVALLLLLFSLLHLDRVQRDTTDPWLQEKPYRIKHPFTLTQSEWRLKATYEVHEGPDEDASPRTSADSLKATAPSAALQPAPALSREMLAKANRFYALRCASCHGASGDGKGPAAYLVKPRPQSFVEPEWLRSANDESLALVILKGGPAIGKNNAMPPTYDLAGKPELLRALVQVIRTFSAPQ